MQELIDKFIDFLHENDCSPDDNSNIKADDVVRRYRLADDKKNTTSASYQLKIDSDFAFGWVTNFRHGQTYNYCGKSNRQFSEEEKRAFSERIRIEKLEREKQRLKDQDEAAIEAKRIWNTASNADLKHPYFKKKKITSTKLRELDGKLIIPMYYAGILVNIQTIDKYGNKIYLSGAKKSGAYYPIANHNDDKSTLIICEGYATGWSLYESLGIPVVVAFDTSGLLPVGEAMREKYPDSKLIYAADNDQWTLRKQYEGKTGRDIPADDALWDKIREDGLTFNPGLEKATTAARTVRAHVVMPDFDIKDIDKPTDFNDLYVTNGKEYVKNLFVDALLNSVPSEASIPSLPALGECLPNTLGDGAPDFDLPPIEAYEEAQREYGLRTSSLYLETKQHQEKDGKWEVNIRLTEKGTIKTKSPLNVQLMVDNHPDFKDMFCYDEFADEKMIVQCPPWEDVDKFKPRAIRDEDITNLSLQLEKQFTLEIQPSPLAKILNSIVEKKRRNPAKEYFNRIQWDGIPRLNTWLYDYCKCTQEDASYLAAVGRKWMTAAVTRVFQPGAKFDHMIIFEGAQGAGKSLMLKTIATIHGRSYFTDTIKVSELGNDRTVPKMQGVLIIEIAELSGFNKKDTDELKAAITTDEDKIVRKYANEASLYPRKFVFAGTINPQQGYLKDPTGNRRFWPVKVGDKIDIAGLEKVREQLWAEAVVCYKKKEKLYLTDEEYALLLKTQETRQLIDPWMPLIKEEINGSKFINVADIWLSIGVDKSRRDHLSNTRINRIMTQLGYIYEQDLNRYTLVDFIGDVPF